MRLIEYDGVTKEMLSDCSESSMRYLSTLHLRYAKGVALVLQTPLDAKLREETS